MKYSLPHTNVTISTNNLPKNSSMRISSMKFQAKKNCPTNWASTRRNKVYFCGKLFLSTLLNMFDWLMCWGGGRSINAPTLSMISMVILSIVLGMWLLTWKWKIVLLIGQPQAKLFSTPVVPLLMISPHWKWVKISNGWQWHTMV